MSLERRVFYTPDDMIRQVERKLHDSSVDDAGVDYITLVPDGEPTLDINLGQLLEGLKELGTPMAVITNSSLLWDPLVRRELALADLVSLKVDSVIPGTWRALDRPHGRLDIREIMEGILEFSRCYKGRLITETMLVEGLNTSRTEMEALSEFLAMVRPSRAYLSVPSRPPAEKGIRTPDRESLEAARDTLLSALDDVELLTGYEGDDFSGPDDTVAALLGILAVHPMRESAVLEFLRGRADPQRTLDRLAGSGRILREVYRGSVYYRRRFRQSDD
jgi:wyosine [tRNA(Phe)-imidazoG37] synthetase (radical SAM superfamily)